MSTKWIFINVVLLAAAAGLTWQLRSAIHRFREENQMSRIQPKQQTAKPAPDPGPAPAAPVKTYNAIDYDLVPAKNVFSEYRAREEKVETPVVVETPPLTVKPVLVGITAMGNRRLAAIIDPTNQGAARKTQTKKLGDSYMGYIVTDITDNTMVLESGTRREVIPLYDTAKRPAAGGKTPIQATRIVAFGAGGTGGGAAGAPVSASAPGAAAAAQQTRRAVVDNPQTTPQPGPVGTQSGILRNVPGASGAGGGRQATPAQAPAWNEGTDAQGRRVIRTPFGDIVRDKPPAP